jgi:hypothetical protein
VRNPQLGIGGLPVLVLVRRHLEDLGMVGDHLLPLLGIAVLVGDAFAVDAVGEDDRAAHVFHRPVHICPNDEPVVHRDRLVPRDPHAVADFGACVGVGGHA